MLKNPSKQTACHDVILVSMPFGPLFQPSIGLSLIQASLSDRGINSSIRYGTIDFASNINPSVYTAIANGAPITYALLGEWLFRDALFGPSDDHGEGYVDNVLACHADKAFVNRMLEIQPLATQFAERYASELIALRPRVIGFTSVFQQHIASLSVAKRVKESLPDCTLVFGGANCEGVMGIELLRQFPFVDAVVSGEGEIVFPDLVERVLCQSSFADLVGVYTSESAKQWVNGPVMNAQGVRHLDNLPIPVYHEFFAQWEAITFKEAALPEPGLLFETARGCWWGQKHHCTFCGLNGSSLAFRSKSPERVINELNMLLDTYGDRRVSVVDNILDAAYFRTVLPELKNLARNMDLFYEVKANLTKAQVQLLYDAGIRDIQPGIESLSTNVLQIMKKGISGVQNIQLLKWCREIGVYPHWNLLWGFPREPAEDYTDMAQLVPALSHLTPPGNGTPIRLDRFSPNFAEADAQGFTEVTPYPAYHYIYPFENEVLQNLAYFFTYQYAQPQEVGTYTHPLAEEIKRWQEVHEQSALLFVDKGSAILLFDLRPVAKQALKILYEPERSLYLACDQARSAQALVSLLGYLCEPVLTTQDVERLCEPLVSEKLMIYKDQRYLSLALDLSLHQPSSQVLQRLYEALLTSGQVADDNIVINLAPSAQNLASVT
ncbi:MAG TPA: RiPP maturation radical SAM C-methyltransferase [Roseiflexaceae bacterium]|nr:RiPP maturation radical SAM C-methyltransferase [Roseiflexaceae bacterium]